MKLKMQIILIIIFIQKIKLYKRKTGLKVAGQIYGEITTLRLIVAFIVQIFGEWMLIFQLKMPGVFGQMILLENQLRL